MKKKRLKEGLYLDTIEIEKEYEKVKEEKTDRKDNNNKETVDQENSKQ